MKHAIQHRGHDRRRRLRSRTFQEVSFNSPTPDSVVTVTTDDGARLRAHLYGPEDAPPLVLVHGWSCCIEYWNPQLNALSERYRVLAYDQRGHGESTNGSRRFDADMLADDLAAVLDQATANLGPAVLVGHSMGGITLQSWAQRHREQAADRAAGFVLANTTWGDIVAETRVLPLLNAQVPAPLWLGKLLFGAPVPLPGDPIMRSLVRARVMDSRSSDQAQADFLLSMSRSCNPRARARAALALADLALGEAGVDAITVPTTVISGRYDKLLPPAMSDRIAEVLSRNGYLDQHVILDTGHAGNIEAAAQFTAEIERLAGIAMPRESRAS